MLTDNEIINAFECCEANEGDRPNCKECPCFWLEEKPADCHKQVRKNALDLINRQKAEIEALQMDKKQLESDIIIANNNYEHIKSIWKNDCQKLSQVVAKWEDKNKRLVIQEEDIKAEAIKEFAERLKENLDDFYHTDEDALFDTADAIDNLVKEMVGDESG